MAKKYVPAGVFLTCDKGTLPTTLVVTTPSRTSAYGQNLATHLDKLPVVNVPPMGVCAITKLPCLLQPTAWNPIKTNVKLGAGYPLLEDSQMRCGAGGCVSIHFELAAAQAACPPPPAPEKSVFDQAEDEFKDLPGPLKSYAQFQVGVAEGVFEGAKGLGEGLLSLAKGGWNAITHPVDTVKAVADNAQKAYKWAGDGQNWANAADSAKKGIGDAATWAGNGENWKKFGEQLQHTSPRDWGKVVGHVAFEVGTTVATAGAMGALNAAAKTSRLARIAVKAIELSDVQGLALKGAGKLARTLAGQMKVLGKVLTGAKRAEKAAARLLKMKNALANSALAQKLKGAALKAWKKIKCINDPVDVASGVMLFDYVDFELPGALPLVWSRWWYSNSAYNGPLGWGWHHSYDAALLADATEVAVRLPDGRLTLFDVPAVGERIFNRAERLELSHGAAGEYRLWSLDERRTYRFAPLAADGPQPLGTVATAQGEIAHRLVAVEDANGFATRLAYDEQGCLRTLTDCAGRQVRLHYDGAGRITALEAPESAGSDYAVLVRYAYDEAGHLLQVTDALGQVLSYVYQADHLMIKKTFRTGMSFYFKYEGSGHQAKCIHTWGDAGVLDGHLEFGLNRTLSRSSIYEDVNVYEHQDGLLTRHIDSLGAVHEWTYTPFSELIIERDPLGRVTRYEYDGRGNQTQVTHPDGVKVLTRYSAQDLPIHITDANANIWQYDYDAAGNMTSSTDPLGNTVLYSFNVQGQLATLTDEMGQTTRLTYDMHGQLAQITEPNDQTSTFRYDTLGRLTQRTDAAGNSRQQKHDLLGRIVAVQTANATWQTLTYDGEDNIILVREAGLSVTFTYTGLGQVATRTESGARVAFTYDLRGNLTGIENEKGEHYAFELDTTGQVVAETGFDGLTRRYQRDAAGRLTQIERPGGRTTTYTYDLAGRVVEVNHNNAERTFYGYRPDGALVEARTSDHTVIYEYDALGRVTREAQNGHEVATTYELQGLRQPVGVSSSLGANIHFKRDQTGLMQRMQADNWQSVIARNEQGLELNRQLSNGVRLNWQRDVLGRPISQRITANGGAERQRRYQWQGSDQLMAIEDSLSGGSQFKFDEWGNLASATYSGQELELRQPDAVGNLFRTHERSDRRYLRGGQLREANGTRYKYDEEGNLIRRTLPDGRQWYYGWDGAGQLITVTRPDGYAVTFTYDALGRRVSKRFRGKITRWVWNGDKPLHEWHTLEIGPGAGSIQDLITWLFEEDSLAPVAKLTDKGAYSIVCDHLGTPLAMYDNLGAPAWEMALDSYGGVRHGRGKPQDCPFRYQGQYEDVETGLYYNRFRYYDPETGTYISQDPIRIGGGLELYNYVSDPTGWIDMLGLAGSPIDKSFPRGRGTFTSSSGLTLESRAIRDLNHVNDGTLKAMAKIGFAPKDVNGESLVLHHHRQQAAGPIIEIPGSKHKIGNRAQHPHGNARGLGLTPAEREAFNSWRNDYWKNRAKLELKKRGITVC